MNVITSSTNRRIRHAIRLRNGRYRRRQGQFLIDGIRELERAISAGILLDQLFIDEPMLRQVEQNSADTAIYRLIQKARSTAGLLPVSSSVFEQIAYGQQATGLVAVMQTPSRPLDHLSVPNDALVVVLDGLEKPGNVGAIFRTADAAGVQAVLCCEIASDLFNPNVVRTSLGTIFSMPSAVGSRTAVQQWLVDRKISPIAARVDGAKNLWNTHFTGSQAIVLGSEADGLDDSWNGTGISVPMSGVADSLNVSVSAAIILFEAKRQRSCQAERKGIPQNR